MALAFDAVSSTSVNLTTSASWSHTTSGSNRLLIVGLSFSSNPGAITAPTYNGVSMTLIRNDTNTALYYLIAPATGANTIALSWVTSVWLEGMSVSLTGADQSSPIDASGTASSTTSMSVSKALTTTKDNAMIVDIVNTGSIYSSISTTGTNQTSRATDKASGVNYGGISTMTTTTAGSYTPGWSGTTFSQNWFYSVVSIAPVAITTTQTITAKSRIQEIVNQTLSGKSRIQETVTKLQTGLARITASVVKTTTGLARITITTTKTISGLARVTATTIKTITGKADIREATTQTQPGKGNLVMPPIISNNIGSWKFDENTGTLVADSSPNGGNDGTWNGTLGSQWTTGILNSGGNFNGTNNYVVLGTSSTFNFERTQAFSIEAWVKTSTTGLLCIFAKRSDTGVAPGYTFLLSSGKVRALLINSVGGNNYIDRQTNATVNDGNWHQVLMTYDGSSSVNGIVFYIDGVVSTSISNKNSLSSSILTTASPAIGATGISDGPAQFFTGVIDEVRLWNRILNSDEVAREYNAGAANTFPTQFGKARVTATTTQTISGKANIRETTTQTISGKANIRETTTQTITGLARIRELVNQTIHGLARITALTTKTITGLSRITASVTKTITGKANLLMPPIISNNVGSWRFDENTGSAVNDSSPSGGNNGTWSGTLGSQWTTGILNSAGSFNGTDNYVVVGNASTFNFERTQAFSIEAWIKTSTSTGLMAIFSKRNTTSPTPGWHFLISSGKVRLLIVSTLTGSNYIDRQTTASISDGSWHQVVMLYDGSSSVNGIVFYIDGALASSTSNNNNLSSSILSTSFPAIGVTGGGDIPAQFFNGVIDEVKLWTRLISSSEISREYASGAANVFPTQFGKARIRELVNQTISGKSRIQQIVNQTILGVARITSSTTRTIQGIARITSASTKTILGLARIQKTTTQTIPGKSRIQEIVTQTQTGKARVTASVSQTQPAKARIMARVNQTITGLGRIMVTNTQTITAKSRISLLQTQTILGRAHLLQPHTTTKTQLGKARVVKSPWYTRLTNRFQTKPLSFWENPTTGTWEVQLNQGWNTRDTSNWEENSNIL